MKAPEVLIPPEVPPNGGPLILVEMTAAMPMTSTARALLSDKRHRRYSAA